MPGGWNLGRFWDALEEKAFREDNASTGKNPMRKMRHMFCRFLGHKVC